jgi:hypothetical protein
MHSRTIIFSVIYLALIGLIIWQQVAYNQLEEKFQEEEILFNANFGEVVRLKDDLGAYEDSLRLLRRDLIQCQELESK